MFLSPESMLRSLASSQKLESLMTLQTINKGKHVSQDESTHAWFDGCSEVCLQTCFFDSYGPN